MAEVDAASTITPSVSTAVTYAIDPVSETDSANQVFGGLYGFWISDAVELPGTPVTGSVVRWTATVPAGASLVVETSVNNGASWDVATNNGPVARLREGDVTTPTVLARITMTRPTLASQSPKVSFFELLVSVDASVDELVPIGHGMIDKVTVSAGSESAGSASGAPMSSGVTGRGEG